MHTNTFFVVEAPRWPVAQRERRPVEPANRSSLPELLGTPRKRLGGAPEDLLMATLSSTGSLSMSAGGRRAGGSVANCGWPPEGRTG